jgi:metal-responsive CopG/Arc/MetJ family transcriptional regulator
MPEATKSHIVKVTGITDNLLHLLDERVKQRHSTSRAEYVRELIRRDVLGEGVGTFREILAPVHAASKQHPQSEEELEAYFDQVREEVYQDRKVAPKQ